MMPSRQITNNRNKAAERQGWHCYYCTAPMTVETCTADHLIPVCKGGTDRKDNIVAACVKCNSRKREMTAEEYFASDSLLKLMRKRGRVSIIRKRVNKHSSEG